MARQSVNKKSTKKQTKRKQRPALEATTSRGSSTPEATQKPARRGAKMRAANDGMSRPPRGGGGTQPRLLSGGNPQIAMGYGDEPVRAYIDAMPGWKQTVGRMLDAIIVRTIGDSPGVRKAVKWNSPLYGAGGEGEADQRGWFMGFHCLNKYVKVAFFRGSSLRPMPPGESKQKEVRYLDIHEADLHSGFDEAQFAEWVRQASGLPGEKM